MTSIKLGSKGNVIPNASAPMSEVRLRARARASLPKALATAIAEAERGGETEWVAAGRVLAKNVRHLAEQAVERTGDEAPILALDAAMSSKSGRQILAWAATHLPRCAELVPAAASAAFQRGIARAVADGEAW